MNKVIKVIDGVLVKLFNIHPIKTTSIFTPAKAADINYISRPELEKSIISNLKVPGKQIIALGVSGSGKTTIFRKILSQCKIEYVVTQCESTTSFQQLLLNAFDALNKYVTIEKRKSSEYNITTETTGGYKGIQSGIVANLQNAELETKVPLLPKQLEPQKLADYYGENNLVWIIEDLHKLQDGEKQRIADILKIFVDNANKYDTTKIICIGANENINELLTLDPDLKNRIAEIPITLLSDNIIRKIIQEGFSLLNIKISKDLEDKLVYYSAKVGSQAHQMCLDICEGAEIYQRLRKPKYLDDSVFSYAVDNFIKGQETTFGLIYNQITEKNNSLGRHILKILSNDYPNKLNIKEIKNKIYNYKKNLRFSKEELLSELEMLCSPQFNVVTYNSRINKYSLSSPFWNIFLKLKYYKENPKIHNYTPDKKPSVQLININDRDALVEKQILELLKKLTKEYEMKNL